MQSLDTEFPNVLFDVPTVKEGIALFIEVVGKENPVKVSVDMGRGEEDWTDRYAVSSMTVKQGTSSRTFDNVDEFYAEMRKPHDRVSFRVSAPWVSQGAENQSGMTFHEMGNSTHIAIHHPVRGGIDRVMGYFIDAAPKFMVEPPPPPPAPRPRVFIGHGRSPLWRDLKDHLAEQHGYSVEAYETGTRSGHTIRDVLDDMLKASSFAILVMTAEDEQSGPKMRARQNVVHEAGLFQGRLGFTKTIVLLEEGTELFSNLDGVQYISFARGNIREAYGDVLAVLRREFPGG